MNNKDKFIFLERELFINEVALYRDEIGFVKEVGTSTLTIHFVRVDKILCVEKSVVEFFDPCKTGDLFSKKVCNICHKLLKTTLFQKNQNAKGNRPVRRPSCNDCRKVIDGTNLTNVEKAIWEGKKPHLIPFRCPICQKMTVPGLTSKVVLDHSHKTGKGRAWICDSCNTGLGRFKDSIELLETAIKYLEKE